MALQEEHEGILKGREDPNFGLTWEEYKSMTFTFQVLQSSTKHFPYILTESFFFNKRILRYPNPFTDKRCPSKSLITSAQKKTLGLISSRYI